MSTQRATSFGSVSDHYDRYRPGPDPAVLDWLLPPSARDVLDIGAGTGALTRLLVERGAQVTAVEPDARMRATLADRVPLADVRAGAAERLPVGDATQDAVLAHSAWHWVDPPRAAREAARVLRHGGCLGVLWTRLDRDVGWVDELTRRLRPALSVAPGSPVGGPRSRRLDLPSDAPFEVPEGPHVVRFTRWFTREDLLGLAGTYSAVIVLSPAARAAVLDRVRSDLEADPRLAERVGLDVPMVSQCWRAERR